MLFRQPSAVSRCKLGVRQGIHDPTQLLDRRSLTRFKLKAGFDKYVTACRIPLKDYGFQPQQVLKVSKGPVGEGSDHFCCDALMPIVFTYPVADLHGTVVDVVSRFEADAADDG